MSDNEKIDMSIERIVIIEDETAASRFLRGEVVFIITSVSDKTPSHRPEAVGMVVSLKDYLKREESHEYIPLINILPLPYRLAYLYDCLNRQRGVARNRTFMFWYRELGKTEWKEWFIVNSYKD